MPAEYAPGSFSKVVGLADLSGNRFAYALFDGGEIWVSDFSDPRRPRTQRYPAGLQPYDGLVTVSYTHLDVYKRQAQYLPGRKSPMGYHFAAVAAPEAGTLSYTEMKQRLLARGK